MVLIVHFKGERKQDNVPKWINFLLRINSRKKRNEKSTYKSNQFKNITFERGGSIKSKGNISITKNFSKAKKNRRNKERIFRQIFYLFRKITEHLERIQNENSETFNGWKEVSRKIDLILFSIHGSIVIIMPIIMFGKFFFMDYSFKSQHDLCKCKI